MTGPLAGLRVADFGRYAVGPVAGMYLGQLGAEVIKVESPEGDGSRRVLPLKGGTSIVYMTVNSNKKNILLDLRKADDAQLAVRLACASDILIENFRPGVIDRFGLGYTDLARLNPRLIYCSGSGYGSRGPMRNLGSTDHFGQAISGFVSLNGTIGGRPEFLRQAGFVDFASAQRLTQAILVALCVRDRTGLGQKVESSQLEAGLGLVASRFTEAVLGDVVPGPAGHGRSICVPDQAFECQDGRWIFVTAETPEQWRRLCVAFGEASMVDDPRFAANADRLNHREALVARLADVVRSRSTEVWMERFLNAGVPAAVHWPDPSFGRLSSDPHVVATAAIESIETPWGVVAIVAPPWRFSATPAGLSRAPRPNEHEQEIRRLVDPGSASVQLPVTPKAEADCRDPLSGLRVVDISQGIAGPSCSMLLGDLGANVIKVEPPGGDYSRALGPPFGGPDSALFLGVNRSKRSIELDLAQPGDTTILYTLLHTADVLVSDLLKEDAQQLGIDFEAIQRENPRLVYCSVTAFGNDGPYRMRASSECVLQAIAGITRFLGALGSPPVRAGADVAAMTTGVYAAMGILAALHEREHSGKGQLVEVNQLLCLLATECSQIARESEPDEWTGPVLAASHSPEHPYQTADGAVHLAMDFGGQEGNWQGLFRGLGLHELCDDARFATAGARRRNYEALTSALETRLAAMPAADVLEQVHQHGGLAVRCHSLRSVLDDPQVQAMDLLVDVQHPLIGRLIGIDVPFDLLGTPHTVSIPPPLLNQHGEQIRSQVLGHQEVGANG